MLEIYYTDPPGGGDKTSYDITPYLVDATWSGDSGQAARKLAFTIAHNTTDKDKSFPVLDLLNGGKVDAFYSDDNQERVQIFSGRIWYRHRNTSQYTFEFTAYDNMIYLAKSEVYKVFDGITVSDAIRQLCQEVGLTVSDDLPYIMTTVNFVADGKTITEVFKTLEEMTRADTAGAYDFMAVCLLDKITAIPKGQIISGYTATDQTDIIHTEHSQSVEDMINRVKAVDETGAVVQIYNTDEDITRYGILQKIYKMQPPKKGETVDNAKAARELLKGIKEESSLEGIGNIQCITGYSITIQEQQLKGNFRILSDTHTFRDGQHTMSLSLEYLLGE